MTNEKKFCTMCGKDITNKKGKLCGSCKLKRNQRIIKKLKQLGSVVMPTFLLIIRRRKR